MRFPGFRLLVGLPFLAAVAYILTSNAQDVPEPARRSDFMRQKLEFSKNILEGLAREDYPRIAQNAQKLKALSVAEAWKLPTIPNVEEYIPFTTDFQRICDDLAKKGEAKNLDGATLAFNRMTMNCVECHRYVRSVIK